MNRTELQSRIAVLRDQLAEAEAELLRDGSTDICIRFCQSNKREDWHEAPSWVATAKTAQAPDLCDAVQEFINKYQVAGLVGWIFVWVDGHPETRREFSVTEHRSWSVCPF